MQLFHLLSQRETNSVIPSIYLTPPRQGKVFNPHMNATNYIYPCIASYTEHYCTQPRGGGGGVIRVAVKFLTSGHRRAHQWCHVICRYYQSTKSSGLSSNLQPTGAKADHLREEMEEAANRMEICRVSHQLQSRHISPYFVFCRWNINIIHLLFKLGILLIDISLW